MNRRRRRPAAGFTLIELMVGSVVMLVALAGAMMVLFGATAQHRRQLERANLERASALLVGQLTAELRQVGLGVPSGNRGGPGGQRLPAAVLQATATDLAFMADLPRPDSSFNGLSRLSDEQDSLAASNGLAVLNELNGTCDVGASPGHCLTNQASALFPSSATDCASDTSSVTCPWALRKYQPGEWLVMANGAGEWLEMQVDAALFGTTGSRGFLQLAGAPWPAGFFASAPNRGFAATPDRVFYRLNAGAVERLQCWEPIGATLTTAQLVSDCLAGTRSTGWEPRARGVASLAFEYRDAADNVIPVPVAAGDLRRIRRVVIQLSMARALGNATVTADTTASATVRL